MDDHHDMGASANANEDDDDFWGTNQDIDHVDDTFEPVPPSPDYNDHPADVLHKGESDILKTRGGYTPQKREIDDVLNDPDVLYRCIRMKNYDLLQDYLFSLTLASPASPLKSDDHDETSKSSGDHEDSTASCIISTDVYDLNKCHVDGLDFPLFLFAVQSGDRQAMDILVKYGANPHVFMSQYNQGALLTALIQDDFDMFYYLTETYGVGMSLYEQTNDKGYHLLTYIFHHLCRQMDVDQPNHHHSSSKGKESFGDNPQHSLDIDMDHNQSNTETDENNDQNENGNTHMSITHTDRDCIYDDQNTPSISWFNNQLPRGIRQHICQLQLQCNGIDPRFLPYILLQCYHFDGSSPHPVDKTRPANYITNAKASHLDLLNLPDKNGENCMSIATDLGNIMMIETLLELGCQLFYTHPGLKSYGILYQLSHTFSQRVLELINRRLESYLDDIISHQQQPSSSSLSVGGRNSQQLNQHIFITMNTHGETLFCMLFKRYADLLTQYTQVPDCLHPHQMSLVRCILTISRITASCVITEWSFVPHVLCHDAPGGSMPLDDWIVSQQSTTSTTATTTATTTTTTTTSTTTTTTTTGDHPSHPPSPATPSPSPAAQPSPINLHPHGYLNGLDLLDLTQNNPLTYAIDMDNIHLVKLLLDLGCNPFISHYHHHHQYNNIVDHTLTKGYSRTAIFLLLHHIIPNLMDHPYYTGITSPTGCNLLLRCFQFFQLHKIRYFDPILHSTQPMGVNPLLNAVDSSNRGLSQYQHQQHQQQQQVSLNTGIPHQYMDVINQLTTNEEEGDSFTLNWHGVTSYIHQYTSSFSQHLQGGDVYASGVPYMHSTPGNSYSYAYSNDHRHQVSPLSCDSLILPPGVDIHDCVALIHRIRELLMKLRRQYLHDTRHRSSKYSSSTTSPSSSSSPSPASASSPTASPASSPTSSSLLQLHLGHLMTPDSNGHNILSYILSDMHTTPEMLQFILNYCYIAPDEKNGGLQQSPSPLQLPSPPSSPSPTKTDISDVSDVLSIENTLTSLNWDQLCHILINNSVNFESFLSLSRTILNRVRCLFGLPSTPPSLDKMYQNIAIGTYGELESSMHRLKCSIVDPFSHTTLVTRLIQDDAKYYSLCLEISQQVGDTTNQSIGTLSTGGMSQGAAPLTTPQQISLLPSGGYDASSMLYAPSFPLSHPARYGPTLLRDQTDASGDLNTRYGGPQSLPLVWNPPNSVNIPNIFQTLGNTAGLLHQSPSSSTAAATTTTTTTTAAAAMASTTPDDITTGIGTLLPTPTTVGISHQYLPHTQYQYYIDILTANTRSISLLNRILLVQLLVQLLPESLFLLQHDHCGHLAFDYLIPTSTGLADQGRRKNSVGGNGTSTSTTPTAITTTLTSSWLNRSTTTTTNGKQIDQINAFGYVSTMLMWNVLRPCYRNILLFGKFRNQYGVTVVDRTAYCKNALKIKVLDENAQLFAGKLSSDMHNNGSTPNKQTKSSHNPSISKANKSDHDKDNDNDNDPDDDGFILVSGPTNKSSTNTGGLPSQAKNNTKQKGWLQWLFSPGSQDPSSSSVDPHAKTSHLKNNTPADINRYLDSLYASLNAYYKSNLTCLSYAIHPQKTRVTYTTATYEGVSDPQIYAHSQGDYLPVDSNGNIDLTAIVNTQGMTLSLNNITILKCLSYMPIYHIHTSMDHYRNVFSHQKASHPHTTTTPSNSTTTTTTAVAATTQKGVNYPHIQDLSQSYLDTLPSLTYNQLELFTSRGFIIPVDYIDHFPYPLYSMTTTFLGDYPVFYTIYHQSNGIYAQYIKFMQHMGYYVHASDTTSHPAWLRHGLNFLLHPSSPFLSDSPPVAGDKYAIIPQTDSSTVLPAILLSDVFPSHLAPLNWKDGNVTSSNFPSYIKKTLRIRTTEMQYETRSIEMESQTLLRALCNQQRHGHDSSSFNKIIYDQYAPPTWNLYSSLMKISPHIFAYLFNMQVFLPLLFYNTIDGLNTPCNTNFTSEKFRNGLHVWDFDVIPSSFRLSPYAITDLTHLRIQYTAISNQASVYATNIPSVNRQADRQIKSNHKIGLDTMVFNPTFDVLRSDHDICLIMADIVLFESLLVLYRGMLTTHISSIAAYNTTTHGQAHQKHDAKTDKSNIQGEQGALSFTFLSSVLLSPYCTASHLYIIQEYFPNAFLTRNPMTNDTLFHVFIRSLTLERNNIINFRIFAFLYDHIYEYTDSFNCFHEFPLILLLNNPVVDFNQHILFALLQCGCPTSSSFTQQQTTYGKFYFGGTLHNESPSLKKIIRAVPQSTTATLIASLSMPS